MLGTRLRCGFDLNRVPLVTELPPARRELIERHLIALPPDERRLRFAAALSDDALRAYARSIRFDRDAAFGAFDERLDLVGFGHLALAGPEAEFGLSVLPSARRQGLGLRLLLRAARHARALGTDSFLMTYLPENQALRELAKRAGMRIEFDAEGPLARMVLPEAEPDALLHEVADATLTGLDLSFRLANRSAKQLTSA
ncbi:MAG: GNAT family N-acetyltransferase [Betaproteobacteria bacterium]|jgi:GNAT superfamily N-acetyltransferase